MVVLVGQLVNCELVKSDIDLCADKQSRRIEVQVMSVLAAVRSVMIWSPLQNEGTAGIGCASGNNVQEAAA